MPGGRWRSPSEPVDYDDEEKGGNRSRSSGFSNPHATIEPTIKARTQGSFRTLHRPPLTLTAPVISAPPATVFK
jgi:hypothetical protein